MKKYIHVGCGNWGGNTWMNRIIPQISDVAECVALVDVKPENVERAGKIIGMPKEALYVDLKKALEEHDVDFVTIASSIASHLTVVKTILENKPGCHIISEKPMAGNMEECMEIYHLVKEAGIKYSVTFSHRYEDDKQTFQKILQEGIGGKLNFIVAKISVARKFGGGRQGGHTYERPMDPVESLFIDGGIHNLDMIRGFTGSNVAEVYAQGWTTEWVNGGSSTPAVAILTMENGVRAILTFEFGGAYSYNSWTNEYFRAECEDASIELDNRRILARSGKGFPTPEVCEIPLLKGDHWKHDLIIRQTLDWIDGGEAPEVNLEDSIYSMGMLYAIIESVRTKKPVNVKEFIARYGL